MVYNEKDHPGWKLFFRSLIPSVASIAISLALVIGIIGLHILFLSRNAELFLPLVTGGSNEQLAEYYTSGITEPLDRAFGNTAFAGLSSALVWGLVGWVVYSLADFLISLFKEIQISKNNIQLPLKNQVIKHPMQGQLLIRVLWRLLISLIIIISLFALAPTISWLFKADVLVLRASSPVEMLKYIGIIVVTWMAIFHLFVVLIRLFVQRTRVFGEIVY